MKKWHVVASLASAAVLLSACGTSVKLDPTPVETRDLKTGSTATTGSAATGAGSSGSAANRDAAAAAARDTQVATVDLTKSGNTMDDGGPAGRVVYFDFDSYVVKDEFRPVVETGARRLTADRKRQMVVEGHTDDRGSSEYNLALGQRRAEAVVRAMALLGVQDAQLEAVSYGEERPSEGGSGETAWAKNRRAELRDR
jgi:peptidoglycan-associated lipoprotein